MIAVQRRNAGSESGRKPSPSNLFLAMRIRTSVLLIALLVDACAPSGNGSYSKRLNEMFSRLTEAEANSSEFLALSEAIAELFYSTSETFPDKLDNRLVFEALPKLIENVESDDNSYLILIFVQARGFSQKKSLWKKWFNEQDFNSIHWSFEGTGI